MNNYKSFSELKEELGNNYDFKLYEMGISALKEIENLQQENKQLKERIEYLERSNNRREDTILEQRQEISDLEDNWNKLREIAKSQSGFKKRVDLKGGLWFEIDDLLGKMQEIEGSEKND